MMTERRMQMAREMRDLADWLGETDDPDIGALSDSHWDLMTLMLKAFVPIKIPEPLSGNSRATFALVLSEVSLQMHVPAPIILSKDRRDHVAFVRQLAMYLCRKMTGQSYPKIGAFFRRDHSTVIHAEQTLATRIVSEPQLARTVEKIHAAILARCEIRHDVAAAVKRSAA
jgi:hypothetical protein